jgi:hypothetical protein
MPVSITATTTLALPVVVFHAVGASMSASLVWSSAQSCARLGSSGSARACRIVFGSAKATSGSQVV